MCVFMFILNSDELLKCLLSYFQDIFKLSYFFLSDFENSDRIPYFPHLYPFYQFIFSKFQNNTPLSLSLYAQCRIITLRLNF